MAEKKNSTVAVITTTIGRETLEKAILSIQAQTYPCKHYVFVDGKEFLEKVKPLEEKYPDVIFTFLPMNSGGKNNIGNGAIHAIAPYLLQEDIFCFLDDDNWHDPDHIQFLVELIDQFHLDYAYSLRWFYTKNYEFLCKDNINSIGFWTIKVGIPIKKGDVEGLLYNNSEYLIDTNSYAITRETAFRLSKQWYSGIGNDKAIFQELMRLNARGGFTGKRTTHYRLSPIYDKTSLSEQDVYNYTQQHSLRASEVDHMLDKPALFIDGKIHTLSV